MNDNGPRPTFRQSILYGMPVELEECRAGVWNALVRPGGKVELVDEACLAKLQRLETTSLEPG